MVDDVVAVGVECEVAGGGFGVEHAGAGGGVLVGFVCGLPEFICGLLGEGVDALCVFIKGVDDGMPFAFGEAVGFELLEAGDDVEGVFDVFGGLVGLDFEMGDVFGIVELIEPCVGEGLADLCFEFCEFVEVLSLLFG